jgi:hypothetical protein
MLMGLTIVIFRRGGSMGERGWERGGLRVREEDPGFRGCFALGKA